MREEVRKKLEQNKQKKIKSKRGRPVGYSPSLKTNFAYWEAKLKDLGLTMERGVGGKLLYDHQTNFGIDEENGKRILLHQALEGDKELGERVINFYVELSHENDVLAWQRILKQQKLLTAHNRRLIARKRTGLKSMLDRGKITKAQFEESSQALIPAALAWQAMGFEEDDEPDPEIDAWVPSK